MFAIGSAVVVVVDDVVVVVVAVVFGGKHVNAQTHEEARAR